MNKRQKRLCRALLDFYDASGAKACPLAELAKKTGFHISDIYDKDSQSGDLWPFDSKARGNLSGMLSFTSGKNATVSITATGLVALDSLCADTPSSEPPQAAASAASPAPVAAKPVPPAPKPTPAAPKPAAPPPKELPPVSKLFSAQEVTEARSRFKYWLKSDPAGLAMQFQHEGEALVEAAFDKFFSEFLQGNDSA